MNFNSLIGLAKEANREKSSQPVKGFSTTITPAKKPARNNVPSASVKAFLEKREQAERDKVIQAMREKERLLALRAQNRKSNKAAKLMASRTKDNDFSRIRLTEDEVEAKGKVEAQLRKQVICDKVERMKARIRLEEHEAQQPHKRKRKSKTQKETEIEMSPSPPPPMEPPPRPNGVKKSRPPPPPAMSFADLMKMASVKQYEDPEDQPEPEEEDRPMTKARKLEEEYKRYKMNGGTGGRTDFELAYFRMQASENPGKPARKRIPKKPPAQDVDAAPERREPQRAPERQNVNRVTSAENAQQFKENRNSYRTDDRDVYRSAESKGVQRTSENKSVQRVSDSRSAFRGTESKNVQRTLENKSTQRPSDSINSKRPSDTVNSKRPSDSMSSKRPSDSMSSKLPSDNTSSKRPSDSMSSKRPSDSMNSYRDGRNSQPTSENRNSRYVDDSRSSQRSSDSVNIQRTSGNKVPQRSSDNVEGRMQNMREQTPKVPSYKTVKSQNVKPNSSSQISGRQTNRNDNSTSESQYRNPPAKHESAFLNSLPNKKPKLGFPAREQQDRSSFVSKYDVEIEKQKSNVSKPNLKQTSSREKIVAEQNRNRQLDSSQRSKPNESIKKSREMPSKPSSAFKKPQEERKPVKVSLNETWLEDDSVAQDQRTFNVPKKKLPPNDRVHSNSAQKRPQEQEVRRDRPQGQKVLSNNLQPVKKTSSNPNGQLSDKKYKQQMDPMSERSRDRDDRFRPPEKKMKRSVDDYDSDQRSDSRPVSKKSQSSSHSGSVKKSMGPPGSPIGSRRNLDTMWPMKSMARNPTKLPPIRSSGKCSFIRSGDSEDEFEDDDYEEEDEDEDMADFIDDGPLSESEDYSRHIREIFGYDKRKYRNETYDDDVMESSFAQQMKEEARSQRIGRLEDLEEEQNELKRKMSVQKKNKR